MRKRRDPQLPEIPLPRPRAGFIPADYDDPNDVELWQVWLRNNDGDEIRARKSHIRRAGFVERRRVKR